MLHNAKQSDGMERVLLGLALDAGDHTQGKGKEKGKKEQSLA